MRNQNKSSHLHLPWPRLAAAGDMGPSLSATDCRAPPELLSGTCQSPSRSCQILLCLWWPRCSRAQHLLCQGCFQPQEGTRSDWTLAEGVSLWLSSPSAPCAWHLHVDTVVRVCCPLGHGAFGAQVPLGVVATRMGELPWGLQGEESLSLALTLLPSLLLTACQQPAQGLGGRICPLEVEGQGLGTASCHERTVRLGGKGLHPGPAPAPKCGKDKLVIYSGHLCEAKTCCSHYYFLLLYFQLIIPVCVISPAGQLWLLRELHKQTGTVKSQLGGDNSGWLGSGGLEREMMATETSEQIQSRSIYI